MSKIWLVTPAFCPADLLEECLGWLYDGGIPHHVEHVIVDNHYPVNNFKNSDRIRALARRHHATYIDSCGDLGWPEGVNNAAREVGIKSGDVVINCDPDDRPSPGFISHIDSVMTSDPKIAVCALGFSVIDQRFAEGKLRESRIAGERVWEHPTVEMVSVCAFNWTFIEAIGGLKQQHKYYGGVESYLYPRWQRRGMRLVYLPDVRADAAPVDRTNEKLFDPNYRQWKTDHVGGYPHSF